MCGITGFIQYKGGAQEDLARRCQTMADTIIHRGPDAGGVWVDPSFPLALGHRRLSIIAFSANHLNTLLVYSSVPVRMLS